MKRIYVCLLSLLVLMPICVSAKNLEEYEYEEAFLKFTIDKDYWSEDEFITNPTLLDKKWTSKCGTVMTSIVDAYDELPEEYTNSLSRKEINYTNVFADESDENLKSLVDSFTSNINIDIADYNYVEYNVKFLHLYGTLTKDDIEMYGEYYITFNNGYAFTIQYLSNTSDSLTCEYSIDEMAKSMYSTIKNENDKYSNLNALIIIIDLILTIFGYMIYPFVRIKVMKHVYTEKQVKNMIMWNSIIVGLIFAVITYSLYGSNTITNVINFAPALFYYYINCAIWVSKFKNISFEDNEKSKSSKEKDDDSNKSICDNCGASVSQDAVKCSNCGCTFEENVSDLENEQQFVCDNCGSLVDLSAKKCPKCGETFEEEEEEVKKKGNKKKQANKDKTESDMNQKYSDLNKLKKLLDKDIITKEEFEKEKKKILNK